MKLVVVENEDVLSTVQGVLEKDPTLSKTVQLDTELSQRITDPVRYRDLLKKVGEMAGTFVVVLDLELLFEQNYWLNELYPELRDQLRPTPDEDESEDLSRLHAVRWMFQGLFVAREAIFNKKIERLCILIASSLGRLPAAQEYLEHVARAAGRSTDVRIDHIGQTLSERPDAVLSKIKEFCLIGVGDLNGLERVWARTSKWFEEVPGIVKDDFVPHTLTEDGNWEHYKTVFENAFELQLHPDIWKTYSSVYALHETLKTMTGRTYRGNSNSTVEMRNLSCGAAYVILLLADKDRRPDCAAQKWREAVQDFASNPFANAQLFADQAPHISRRAALGIYSLFWNLLEPEPKHGNSQVAMVELKDQGRTLVVRFDSKWQQEKFVARVVPLHTESKPLCEIWFSEETPSRVLPSIGALWRAQVSSSLGFGSPGSIWMERNSLRFHSGAQSAPIGPLDA